MAGDRSSDTVKQDRSSDTMLIASGGSIGLSDMSHQTERTVAPHAMASVPTVKHKIIV